MLRVVVEDVSADDTVLEHILLAQPLLTQDLPQFVVEMRGGAPAHPFEHVEEGA